MRSGPVVTSVAFVGPARLMSKIKAPILLSDENKPHTSMTMNDITGSSISVVHDSGTPCALE